MAEDIEDTGKAAKTPEAAQPKLDASGELPATESPPLSPAGEQPEPAAESALVILPPANKSNAHAAHVRFRLRPRHKRQAVLAASVAIAAGLGVVIGALATTRTPRTDTAGLQQQQAMQQSISSLTNEVASLKANLEAGTKSARSQIAKISERLNRPPAPETTGSIPAPPAAVPTPVARPPVRTAAVESRVVPDWSIRDVRGGYVYVQGHGDIYEVVPGAPLPGLGPVREITRRDGRWVVVTPKGLIVSQRDRHYFEPY